MTIGPPRAYKWLSAGERRLQLENTSTWWRLDRAVVWINSVSQQLRGYYGYSALIRSVYLFTKSSVLCRRPIFSAGRSRDTAADKCGRCLPRLRPFVRQFFPGAAAGHDRTSHGPDPSKPI
ncbi:hypothetical protein Bbelb_439820 [Branchiostoma belcheri]|nr:hypothetical protein Bbelb_439820 [Branchiostoma belcheri]